MPSAPHNVEDVVPYLIVADASAAIEFYVAASRQRRIIG